MANIKISELNELYEAQRDYNDYVPVVDTSADETKKISVKNLIRSNVQLIAVIDTEPAEYETGDKYYNTTDNRIYTATSSGWANAETPIRNIFYVIISDKTTYTYDDDNETLVTVGSASGSVVNNYSTSTTEGYSCNYVNNTIVNAYTNSQTSAYSTEYVNSAFGGTILWTNPSPTSTFAAQNITLSSNDYDMYEIIYKPYYNQETAMNTGKIPKAMGTTLIFNAGNSTNGPYVYRRDITYTNATTLAAGTATEAYASTNAANNNNCIPLYIIGYKTNLFN